MVYKKICYMLLDELFALSNINVRVEITTVEAMRTLCKNYLK